MPEQSPRLGRGSESKLNHTQRRLDSGPGRSAGHKVDDKSMLQKGLEGSFRPGKPY